MLRLTFCILMIFFAPKAALAAEEGSIGNTKPVARPAELPAMRWDHRPESSTWTRSALAALRAHGTALTDTVPRDISAWCPGYVSAAPPQRRAFWVGFMSALAKFESTYRPDAVGCGGKWYGLLQILPATARGYGCNARSGAALKDGAANLSCAIRIMSVTVARDQAIAIKDSRWRGVAADWGPMRSSNKRADMTAWLRQQPYCAVTTSPRPVARPSQTEPQTGD